MRPGQIGRNDVKHTETFKNTNLRDNFILELDLYINRHQNLMSLIVP